ncbi:D-erythro-sphingosine kinase [Micromonas pusilla CCMP1545]|uniref:D-erythro-sphingosine kinase n=1 Tax=Micromonas pusilla (strain CCMP1545) TaxID=564608 RepID=C1N1F6_MICPC|nr:D-erythro-sphingosine kinase [Micromonas pusilla CCMP1545]EEH54185.1 D-erythro-sphingosine kinase [Micromonas pusilla CCMP1545]|eukprot:XP_003061555.1 D-erythro-sphingosine kinase [Micromonas pusilla CCMP1545]
MPNGATWSDAEKKKRLLVLVNPAAGKGNDVSAYERDVAPVLECAFDRARIDVVVTTRRGEAQERVASMDLQNTAAVVCVGGDGTIAEVFNGLMSRGGAAEKFPIGMIPAGSGNAIAKSLAHAGGEPCDRASAALAVARGHIAPAGNGDAAATAATASVMHSLLSFSWGFFADVDIESETMRWLGGLRFTIQAIVRILFLRRYSAKLRFKPLAITPDAVPAGKKSKELAIGQEPKEAAAVAAMDGASAGDAIADRPGWREIEGDVQGLWALNLPWGGEDMYAAPGAAPDDGCYDLLVIAGASRLSLLGLLLIFDGGAHCTHPAVTYVKASAFELDPGPSHTGKGGFIAVDGELVARADGKWGRTRRQARSPSHWSPYDPVGVVNADP